MYKMKPKKCVRKRVKLTANGKLLRCKQGRRHILTKKSSKRKRHLKKKTFVSLAFERKYANIACL